MVQAPSTLLLPEEVVVTVGISNHLVSSSLAVPTPVTNSLASDKCCQAPVFYRVSHEYIRNMLYVLQTFRLMLMGSISTLSIVTFLVIALKQMTKICKLGKGDD